MPVPLQCRTAALALATRVTTRLHCSGRVGHIAAAAASPPASRPALRQAGVGRQEVALAPIGDGPLTTPTRHCTTVPARPAETVAVRVADLSSQPAAARHHRHSSQWRPTHQGLEVNIPNFVGALQLLKRRITGLHQPTPGSRPGRAGPGRRPWLRLWHMLAPPCVESTRISLKGAGCSG